MRCPVVPTLLVVAATIAHAAPAAAWPADDFARWISGPVSVLMTAEELEIVTRITGTGLEDEFIAWFWARRDPNPDTHGNEFRQRFQDRRAHADKEFGEGPDRPGWATPRGQIYLLLGDPRSIGRSWDRYLVDGVMRSLEIWAYDHPRARTEVRFAFVRSSGGVKLAVAGRKRLEPPQVELLDTVRSALVHDPSRRFREAAIRHTEPLPLLATLAPRDGGTLAALALPLQTLLGEPVADGIRYRIAIATRAVAGTDVSDERYLGTVEVTLDAADHLDWSDRPLQIALWLPASARELRMTEIPTGRTTTIATIANGSLPDALPLARVLGVTPLVGGSSAVAFFPTCPQRHPVATSLLVSGADERVSRPLPGGRLAFALPERQPR